MMCAHIRHELDKSGYITKMKNYSRVIYAQYYLYYNGG